MIAVDLEGPLKPYGRHSAENGRGNERMETTGLTVDRHRLLPAARGSFAVSSPIRSKETLELAKYSR